MKRKYSYVVLIKGVVFDSVFASNVRLATVKAWKLLKSDPQTKSYSYKKSDVVVETMKTFLGR